jgi:hypothetical protein
MRFLRPLASRRTRARALIDVSASSVAGALATYPAEGPATLVWTKRVPIIAHADEPPETAMGRALELIAGALVSEGAPVLARLSGSGRLDGVRVALDAPWQETDVRISEVREEQPFTFTRKMLARMLEQAEAEHARAESLQIEQHVIGVRLNGYQTREPIGKRAHRASLTVITSSLRHEVVEQAEAVIRRHLHLSRAAYVSGPASRFQMLRAMFPHERDLLIIDSVGRAAAISLVRTGTLAAVKECAGGDDEGTWVAAVGAVLRELATMYPLPRTVLLVAPEDEAKARTQALGSAGLGALWLSDEPPSIIPVTRVAPEELVVGPEAQPDIRLALMARYDRVAGR